ncbi:Rv3235 family protein [Subtercola endophyticus]|uniref:Rv3235 family protein n=1 Tax=Subtercola endophyticus TaxID=2895559 RepID=UPI001E4C7C87|nr:Rv3235 family protein [Subtercola endophyticus]UFS57710.1 Rv3235 family protein [Subtercola endophyticus]
MSQPSTVATMEHTHPHTLPGAHEPLVSPVSPSAREFLETLTRVVLEVLAGVRDIDQIARWVSDDVYKNLSARVRLSSRARQVTGQRVLRPTFCIGRTVLSEPLPGVIEGVVIVHGKARSRAVALRLEHLGTRWRASTITVL